MVCELSGLVVDARIVWRRGRFDPMYGRVHSASAHVVQVAWDNGSLVAYSPSVARECFTRCVDQLSLGGL